MAVINTIVGACTETSARVIAKIDGSEANLAISSDSDFVGFTSFGPFTPDSEGIVIAEPDGLDPDTRWFYQWEVDGEFDGVLWGQFPTHPTLGEPASFAFAASSCAAGSNVPGVGDVLASDRISNNWVFDDIREYCRNSQAEGTGEPRDPLFFEHTGDRHYYDLGSGDHGISGGASLSNYRRAYDDVLLQPRQHQLNRHIPLVYTWDDHDYGPGNSDGTFSGKANAAQVYRERVPHYPLAEADAIYHSFQIARVLFIVWDLRYYRSPNDDPDDADKTMMGQAQKDWMQNLLDTNPDNAEFLVVFSSIQWIGGGSDSWTQYTTERDELRDMFRSLGWEDRMLLIGGNNHRIGFDSGGGNEMVTGAKFPVFTVGSMDSISSGSIIPLNYQYDQGPSPADSGHWAKFDVRDRGHQIEVRVTGLKDHRSWRSHRVLVDTSTGFVAP